VYDGGIRDKVSNDEGRRVGVIFGLPYSQKSQREIKSKMTSGSSRDHNLVVNDIGLNARVGYLGHYIKLKSR
jgi:hypothetical protein